MVDRYPDLWAHGVGYKVRTPTGSKGHRAGQKPLGATNLVPLPSGELVKGWAWGHSLPYRFRGIGSAGRGVPGAASASSIR